MDEKRLIENYSSGRKPASGMIRPPKARGPLRLVLAAILSTGLCSLLLLHTGLPLSPMSLIWRNQGALLPYQTPQVLPDVARIMSDNVTRVPLEAHIMSQCPDARDCLRDLVVPAMERIADKVDFRLSFIGEYVNRYPVFRVWLSFPGRSKLTDFSNRIDADESIHCRHGQTECLGNILALCANELYPDDVKISLGFTTCMIRSYRDIPKRSLVQNCALEHGVDFDSLNGCVSAEGKGLGLLEASVKRSKEAGVKYSCTIRLDEKFRCIRDGGQWKDCEGGSRVEDLVDDVKRLYNLKNQNS